MPLLSKLVENRSQTNATVRASVRYCDSEFMRHLGLGNTVCSYVSPMIASLVPEDQRHSRVRNGVDCSHFSFNAIHSASLLLRVSKRFETIENDRQENIVDVLNDISHKIKDSQTFLQSIVRLIDGEGSVCSLLKEIRNAFRDSLITESPQLDAVSRNTAFIMDNTSDLKGLRDDLISCRTEQLKLQEISFDKILDDIKQVVTNGSVVRDNMTSIVDLSTESVNELKEIKENLGKNASEMSSIKYELEIMNSSVEKMDANLQMNVFGVKQELVETKHEILQIKEEIRSLRDAIIDILPQKMMEIFNQMSSDRLSAIESDIELIDGEQLDQMMSESEPKKTESP